MLSIYGFTKQDELKSLVELCFNKNADQCHYDLIDQGIRSDSLSGEQYRVLPLLYAKSDMSRFSEYSRKKISSAYKHTHYRNHILLDRSQKLARSLDEHGFKPAIFLKGIPQALRSKGGIGTRPMSDVDILIPKIHLNQKGFFTTLAELELTITSTSFRSVTAISSEGFEFDIHWYLGDWGLSETLIEQLEESSEPISFRGSSFQTPCVEHHIVHILGHALMNPLLMDDARWIIDALMLLTEYTAIKPEKLADFANQFNARNRIKLGLRIIAEQTPSTVLIDRSSLCRASNLIKPDKLPTAWLFDLPEKNKGPLYSGKEGRQTWIKTTITGSLYVPYCLWRLNKLPLSNSFALSQGLSARDHLKAMACIVKKVFKRLPFLAFNIWIDKGRRS